MEQELKELEQNIVNNTGTYILNCDQVSKIINKSKSTLNRWRDDGIYIEFRKVGISKNATIEYTAKAVAKYILKNPNKVI